jgi:hypothetical protein
MTRKPVKLQLFTMRVDASFFEELDILRDGRTRSATVREIIGQLASPKIEMKHRDDELRAVMSRTTEKMAAAAELNRESRFNRSETEREAEQKETDAINRRRHASPAETAARLADKYIPRRKA